MPVPMQQRIKDSEARAGETRTAGKRRTRRESNVPSTFRAVGPMRYRWYLPCKRAVDFLLALALLAVAAPAILLAAALVRLTSRGPAFYSQTRVGQYGRHFTIFKLRTMVDNCESLTGPRWSIPGDPRITRVGDILRLTHLDELPQLVNVLRGDMSLIGPRPERPEFLPKLDRQVPGYRDRLAVRPGVTGLAQLQLRADTEVDDVRRKVVYDLFYIRWLSPLLDLKIMLCTGLFALGVPFRIAGRCLRVPQGDAVEGPSEAAAAEAVEPRPRIAA